MPGRTLRDAIADAIADALAEAPSVLLAAGPARSHRVLRDFLLGWIKEYAFHRGVIFEDRDLEHEIVGVIAELRGQEPAASAPCVVELPAGAEHAVTCPDCNAKPNWQCTNIISGKYRESHTRRIAAAVDLARKGAP